MFPVRLESSSSHLSSIFTHHFPFLHILDHNLRETAKEVAWVCDLTMLARSFEDQGPVFFLAQEKIAGPPTWTNSLLAP